MITFLIHIYRELGMPEFQVTQLNFGRVHNTNEYAGSKF